MICGEFVFRYFQLILGQTNLHLQYSLDKMAQLAAHMETQKIKNLLLAHQEALNQTLVLPCKIAKFKLNFT